MLDIVSSGLNLKHFFPPTPRVLHDTSCSLTGFGLMCLKVPTLRPLYESSFAVMFCLQCVNELTKKIMTLVLEPLLCDVAKPLKLLKS